MIDRVSAGCAGIYCVATWMLCKSAVLALDFPVHNSEPIGWAVPIQNVKFVLLISSEDVM